MSFGASNTTKAGMNDIGGAFNTAVNKQLPLFNQFGGALLGQGQQTTQPGIDFLNTILQGNRANTAALLQPNINDITGTQQAALRGINTLMPRGGGRYGSLFAQSLAPQAQIQNLFNPMRATAATALPQIGLQQTGQGINMFNLGNQALQTGAQSAAALTGAGQTQQQMTNSLLGGLGSGLFSLLTAPFTGGASLLGKAASGLGSLFGGSRGIGGASSIPGGLLQYGIGPASGANPYDTTFGVYG